MAGRGRLFRSLGLWALLAATPAAAEEPPHLTAWIIPHSHCDPGWLESFESYYNSQVSRILSSVTQQLLADPSRRFVWAETSFFMRWYESQGTSMQADVRRMISEGQLEFVGGGWVQNDEANPDYASTIAQMTEGHELLLTLFGVKPTIAVQFDPFGHSSQTAAIAAMAGYSAIVLNRIDHTLKDALKARAAMEFVWKPYAASPAMRCASGGGADGTDGAAASDDCLAPGAPATAASAEELASYSNASIFAHVLHTHYSAPRGFDFENPEGWAVGEHNKRERANALAEDMRRRAAAYRSSHLLVSACASVAALRARFSTHTAGQCRRQRRRQCQRAYAPVCGLPGMASVLWGLPAWCALQHCRARASMYALRVARATSRFE